MVSVAVLAVLAVGVAMSTGRGVTGAERDAERFRRAVEQNWALSILSREPRGLAVTTRDLQLMRPRSDENSWTATALYGWSASASLRSDGPAALPGTPDILFFPDGRSSGFSIVFSGRGPVWRCTSDGWSAPTCAAD